MSSRCVRLQTWASLLLSWVVLGVWLAIGAQVMSELELQADRQRNQDYCTTLKEIRDTLTNADFQAWEQLLRAITGRGICRAPNCGGDFLGANATAGAGNSTNSTSSATAEAVAPCLHGFPRRRREALTNHTSKKQHTQSQICAYMCLRLCV